MKEKIFGAKRTIQRGMVIQLSIAIILVIILSAISLYIFTHQAIAKYMVFNIDTETARNELWKIFRLGIGIIVVNTILISFAIIRISTKILAEPLKKSIEATKKVAEGDFTVRLETKRDDEIKELVDNFNIMVEQLGKTEILQKDFIDNVSHEIKTPINSIQGFTKLLDDNNLSEQIKKAVLLLEPKWKDKNINFSVDAKEVYFYGDEDLLFQVWTNILDNAIKFSNENGKISVKISVAQDKISVSIKDNGIGMDSEELGMIYTRFYQIDKSHSGEGSGLGLAIVKRIVEISNGEINVQSEKGKGTTFTIILPQKKKTNKIVI